MEWPSFVKALLWGLLVFLQFHQHRGCFHEERIALLELKAFLKSNIIHADVLPSWMDDAKSDCCSWERVTCNSTNSHVINLSLYNLNHDPDYYEDYDYNYYGQDDENRWLLNVSMLVPLKELKSLNLSANSIGGCLPNEGFEKMSSLRNLRILDLGYNYFDNNSIPQSLGAVTSLETLILTQNKLQGYFPAQELIALRNLNKLDISRNYYNGFLPLQGFERLALLPKLEILDLCFNSFNYSIIPSLSGLASLKTLSLAGNDLGWFNTTTGFESLSRLENLETLDLSHTYLERSIIESLPAVKSLKNLNLEQNFIGGSFPIKGISAFENLEKLDLSYNILNGSLTIQGLESLSRLKKLETLDLRYNFFDKSIIESLSAVKSHKNLNLAWNHIGGSFPAKELSAFENLEKLDLSWNNFEGPLTIQGNQPN
ncbi:receptor like protein 21-like [Corylus avellana]|uniref:receptor like protein 21-like n=1 Tax=Corylus avellana TaxID=13451 RepID=UPI00286B86DD|nr:receptor like protein 21-like [Corylus avellana]